MPKDLPPDPKIRPPKPPSEPDPGKSPKRNYPKKSRKR